jgi:hypothetical protein
MCVCVCVLHTMDHFENTTLTTEDSQIMAPMECRSIEDEILCIFYVYVYSSECKVGFVS